MDLKREISLVLNFLSPHETKKSYILKFSCEMTYIILHTVIEKKVKEHCDNDSVIMIIND